MLVRRCAWHRRYHGYPTLYGIASWRGWKLRFTDGACPRCVLRLRNEFNIAAPLWPHRPEGRLRKGPLVLPPAAVGLVVLGMFLVLARPLDQALAPFGEARLDDPPSALVVDGVPLALQSAPASSVGRMRAAPAPSLRALSPGPLVLATARTSGVIERARATDCIRTSASRVPVAASLGAADARPPGSTLQAP